MNLNNMRCEAWILEKGELGNKPGRLLPRQVNIAKLGPEEILVAPIYGCLEANLLHAIQRQPVDICQQRGEPFIIPGNACVAKIMEVGADVRTVVKGDLCMGFGIATGDAHGYPVKVLGYDAPHVSGILAKRVVMKQHQMIPLPVDTRFSLEQWAAFSARYVSAWSNWKVARACWDAQMSHANPAEHYVCGWGGGVSLAELELAKREGFNTIMITSRDSRHEYIASQGITPVNRRAFPNLDYQPSRYIEDAAYREAYKDSERKFLERLSDITGGKMIDIFFENIGQPVYRATLKALARQAVLATCGWKMGMEMNYLRAIESINRHIHVHTHYATYDEVVTAMAYADRTGWMPDIMGEAVYSWDEIPDLCEMYANEGKDSYFPVFAINELSSLD